MLKDIIKNFPEQLNYEPVIENGNNFHKKDTFIICGMGGSNLAAGIIKGWKPKSDIVEHRDYGLPTIDENQLKGSLVIASSYSGNTAETISAFQEALAREMPLIVIAAGGKLLELAKQHDIPFIQLPQTSHPRFATGLSIKATLKALGEEAILNDVSGTSLNSEDYKETGEQLAKSLKNLVPLVYSSMRNRGLGYFWKIQFNETAKIPAFSNILPELNHNEMVGFSEMSKSKLDHKSFAFVFLSDPDDKPQIQKRFFATKKVLEDRGFGVFEVSIVGPSLWHKTFAGMLTSFWTSYFLAKHYGIDAEDTSMIEDFKKSLL